MALEEADDARAAQRAARAEVDDDVRPARADEAEDGGGGADGERVGEEDDGDDRAEESREEVEGTHLPFIW